jgi:NDP-sugar pyrophosphorylase family protein
MSRFLPPSKVLDADVKHSIIGDGCVIKAGSKVSGSVVGIRSLIGANCVVEVRCRRWGGAGEIFFWGGHSLPLSSTQSFLRIRLAVVFWAFFVFFIASL